MKKLHGFENEYLYVLPSEVLNNFTFSDIVKQLYITDLGFYPKAKFQFVHRDNGARNDFTFCFYGVNTRSSIILGV